MNTDVDEASVTAGLTSAYLNSAVSRRASVTQLLANAGTDPNELCDPDNRVPIAAHQALVKSAQMALSAPDLVLAFSFETRSERMTAVALIVQAPVSMAQAIVELNRHSRLMVDGVEDVSMQGDRFETITNPDGIWIVDKRPDHHGCRRTGNRDEPTNTLQTAKDRRNQL